MNWFQLYEKIGKQYLRDMKAKEVFAMIDGKNVPMMLCFKNDGTPYLIPKGSLPKIIK